jgi:hypothetical protein
VLKYTVSFMLSKSVHAETLKADFVGTMNVTVDEGDGQFAEPEMVSEDIVRLQWTLWHGITLEAGKEYTFEITGELPPQTPRSWRTPSGSIEYILTVRLEGVTDSGKMRRTKKTIEVWNPFSMGADDPRPGLDFHADLEPEMFGTSVVIDRDLAAFLRFPDQCFKGIRFKGGLIKVSDGHFQLIYRFPQQQQHN